MWLNFKVIVDLQRQHGGKARSHPSQEYILMTQPQYLSKKHLLSEPYLSISRRKEEMINASFNSWANVIFPKEYHSAWILRQVLSCAPDNSLHTPHPFQPQKCLPLSLWLQTVNGQQFSESYLPKILQQVLPKLGAFWVGW